MDIFEFELRYYAYSGLSKTFELNFSQEDIIEFVKRSNKGQLEKKITETTPTELKELTLQTFTERKIKLIKESEKNKFNGYSLAEYINRLEYELKVIKEMGYNTYFLIVQDYINWARKNEIAVGPGRGSAAGSLLSYLIGITDLDPMEYDLLFERFLNPARISMPDIDTDFEDTQRDRLLEYVKDKYGKDKVATIGTYMTMAAKAAFKDVARVFGIPFDQSNRISNLITEKTIQKSLDENEEFKNSIEGDPKLKEIVDLSIKLEGTVRQTGVHACGVIISPDQAQELTPLQYPPKAGTKNERDTNRIVTQYDGHFLEDLGLLKMDFLGLRNLSIIKNTIKILTAKYKNEGKKIPKLLSGYFENMEFNPHLEDKLTYEKIFQKGDTSGVFQFESDGMKNWLKKLKPNNIDDLIAMVSLYRPGPMEFIPHYIDRKHGKENISYMLDEDYDLIAKKYGEDIAQEEKKKLTEDLSGFMDITYGIAIYQEQLMRIVQSMAGFSLAEADMLRRGVGKKIKEVIEQIKIEFIKKAGEFRQYKEETAIYVYEKMIEPAANYSFNKSHAACYAIIAYHTAYLKANFPIEFGAALLRSVEEDTEKFAKFVNELKIQGFKVLSPNINESFKHVSAIEDTVRIGFVAMKGIGYDVAQNIENERINNGKYKDLEDFLKRNSNYINKKSLEALTKSGALDEMEDRNTILENIKDILDWLKMSNNSNGGGLFDMGEISGGLTFKEKFNTTLIEKLHYELETFKTFISAHPFDGLYAYLKSKGNFISMFKEVEDYGEFNIVGFIKDIRKAMKKGYFITIEDISDEVDIFVKEILDLKVLDIIKIRGYKGKSIRIKEMVKMNIDDILKKAKNNKRYNENESALIVRAKRIGSQIKATDIDEIDKQNTDIKELEGEENFEDYEKKSDSIEQPKEEQIKYEFPLPDDLEKIKKLADIIKKHNGDTEIILGGKKYLLDENGIKQVNELYK